MAKREFDTSQAKCDTCGKPYQQGQALYTIADKVEEIGDKDVLISFRHWDCHTPIEKQLADIKTSVKRAEDALDRLRKFR